MAGRLDVEVDPASLFTVSLHEPGAADRARLMFETLEESDRQRQRGKRTLSPPSTQMPPGDDLVDEAQRELARAQLDFLSLPAEERRRLLSEHARRQRAATRDGEAQGQKLQLLAALEAQAEQLEAFLEGTLDPSVDPEPLLGIDLLAADEIALDRKRRSAFLREDAQPPIASDQLEKLGLDASIDLARARIDAQRRRFVAMTSKERSQLFDRHRAKRTDRIEAAEAEVSDAEEAVRQAAEEHQQAVEDQSLPQSEARRLVAEERATLLAVKREQALHAAGLAKQRTEAEAVLESALAWSRRVKELEESTIDKATRSRTANDLYTRVVRDLSQARDALRTALSLTTSRERPIPAPASEDASPLLVELDDGSVRALRDELQAETTRLRAQEAELRWERATILRDAVVLMNRARLRLFDDLGERQRNELTGFGPKAVQQVKRELDQITLEATFNLLSVPRGLRNLYERLQTSPGPIVAVLVQVLVLVLVFVWWRRRADSVLERIQRAWLKRRPQGDFTRAVAGFAWYLRRIRKPLEWLVLLGVLIQLLVARFGTSLGITYLRIVVVWALTGALVVRLIDAIADRQGYSSEFSSKLRFRSLRLAGVTIVLVGLVLSITDATVGKGAIYAWVIKTCWFLVIPVGIVLVAWWSGTIFERAAGQESSATLRWVANRSEGALKFPAAAVGGIYLLVDGVYRFILAKATELAPARRLLAYLSRRGVEKQALGNDAPAEGEPIPADVHEKLTSETASDEELVRSYMSPEVHAMRALVRSERASIVAIVGERGEGKTTFLGRVVHDLDDRERYEVRCESGGFPAFFAQLAAAVDLQADAEESQVVERLNERAPKVVAIDDAHRLIKPLIGGLRDIDRLVRLMRGGHPETTWLIAMSMPAWHYVQRARSQRTGFDQVIELLPWEEEQIIKLVEQRNAVAGITPSFEELVVPQQFAGSRVSEDERTRRDFYRILWDYAGGNPLVALHFWRESLYVRASDGQICVRLPKVPSARDLDGKPNSLYFVLRTITQLERASEEDIVRCTDLDQADVADALRAAKVHGYVEERDRLFEISTHWYRAVTGILSRKHLMLL